jgi:hypothetical protein
MARCNGGADKNDTHERERASDTKQKDGLAFEKLKW